MNAKRIASLVTVVLALFIFAFALTACQECEHVWEAATCTSPKTCSICNKTEGAPAGHTVVVDTAVAPTCTSTGLTEGTHCSTCGEVLVAQAFLDKAPHTEQIKEGYAPTCLRDGLSDEIKCGVCHEILQEQTVLPMVECNYVEVVTPNICVSEGYSTFTCSFCSDSYIDNYTPATGHSYTEWTTNGSRTIRNCENISNCGAYQEIVALSATYVGDTLFVGEKINVNNIKLSAVLSDKTSVSIDEFVIDKNFEIADGDNYIEVSFMTLSCKVIVPAIHDNLPGSASDVEFAYHTLNKNTEVMIDGYNGTDTEVVIPSYIVVGGVRVPVRYIGDSAFFNTKITKVVIPPSVKQIESHAFLNCTALKEIDLGNSLQYISDSAFRNCSSLSFIEIPASVFSLRPCFEGCTSLERVVLNEGLEYIGETTFENCPIKTIVIPNSVKSLGTAAFSGCKKLTDVVIGNNVAAIESATFKNCESLKNVVIGSSVAYINGEAFTNCTSLETIKMPDSVESIGSYAFQNCTALKEIDLGNSLQYISDSAFRNCSSLSFIEIPGSVFSLRPCFEGCTSLERVVLNEGLEHIGESTFANCPIKSIVIPDSVKSLGNSAFDDCKKLTDVVIGNNVAAIESATFQNCESLKNVVIGSSVAYINGEAFTNCTSLETIKLPDSVESISSYAFQNCTALKEVDLGNSLQYISDSAFRNCSSLSFIEIPGSMFSLRPCFEGCTSLERVVLNEGLQYIGENTFANCPIKTIVIPNSVRSIGARAFNGCTKLTSAVIGNLVEAIETSTFQGCYSLENVVIGSNVKYIDENAFSGCTFLRNVTIIKGELLNLNGNSFPGCSFFKRIFYTGTEKDWRKIMIYDEGVYPLTCDTPYFYSESEPTEKGNYWFYSNEGMPVIWNLTDKAIEADTYTYEFIREHVGRSDSLTYDTYYDMLEDPAFMLTFGLYETLDFLVDATDGAKKLTLTKKELYEVAIYDVLIMSVKKGDEEEKPPVWEQCATTIQEYVDTLKNFLYPDESNLENIEFAAELLDTLTGSSVFSKLSDGTVGKIKEIGEKYENAYDALNAIGRYLALMEASENFRLILLDISNNSSNPLALRSAAEDVADCLNDSFIEVIGKIIEGNVYEKIDDMLSEIVNKAWDKLLDSIFPGFATKFTTAAKGVQLFMKATLNMDEASMAFYQVSAAANFEIALRRLLINTPDFLRWSGEDHVAKHNDIVLLYKSAMMKGFDYCRDFYDKCTTDDMNLADIDMKKVERELSYYNFEVFVQEKCDSYKNVVESYS